MSIASAQVHIEVHELQNEQLRRHVEWLLPTAEDLWSLVQQNAAPMVARRIAVVGVREGYGATTLAVALSHFLWRRLGKRVLLIETDMRKPSFETYGLVPAGTLGLLGVLEGDHELEHAIVKVDPLGFCALPAGRAADSPATQMTEANLGVVCLKLNPLFDYVVFDSPALLGAPEARVPVAGAESVVAVLGAGSATPEESAYWLQRIWQYGGNIGATCLNGVRSPLPRWLRKWL